MFCTCSRSCSIATFMSTEIAVSSSDGDFEPSVLASRCSSWIRKSSRLPISPPLSSRRVDLVEVRAQARQLLGDVDADRERRGFVERALLRSPRARPTAPRRPMSSASFQRSRKRCCCALHGGRHQRLGLRRRARAGGRRARQHRGQPLAFARARLAQAARRSARRPSSDGVARALASGRAAGTTAAPRAPTARALAAASSRTRALERAPGGCSCSGVRLGARRSRRRAAPVSAQLDLAALEARREQFAQRRLEAAQLVGQAQREVEKAAVDRADLDRRARRRRRLRGRARDASCNAAALAVGALAEAWRSRSCCKLPRAFAPVFHRLCQSQNPRRCHPARSWAATRSSRSWRPAASAWSTSADDSERPAGRPQGIPAFVARRALARRADAPRQARKAAALPAGPEELLRGRPLARADLAHQRGLAC